METRDGHAGSTAAALMIEALIEAFRKKGSLTQTEIEGLFALATCRAAMLPPNLIDTVKVASIIQAVAVRARRRATIQIVKSNGAEAPI